MNNQMPANNSTHKASVMKQLQTQSVTIYTRHNMDILLRSLIMIAAMVSMWSCAGFEGGTFKPLQDDFDKIRLNDVNYIFDAAIEYKASNGQFPFKSESDSEPVIIVFETEEQNSYHKGDYPLVVDIPTRFDTTKPAPKINHASVNGSSKFYSKMNMNRPIPLLFKFDPQRVPTRKPCIYVYVEYKGVVDVTCFLHNKFNFTRVIGEYDNKFALTSSDHSNPRLCVWRKSDIESNPVYNNFRKSSLNKPGYDRKIQQEQQNYKQN